MNREKKTTTQNSFFLSVVLKHTSCLRKSDEEIRNILRKSLFLYHFGSHLKFVDELKSYLFKI